MNALPDTLRAASARRYLRGNLPAVYSESPHRRPLPVMGLLEGLERVLDPLVILLDNLAGHLRPATAPAEILDFLMEAIGAPVDHTLPLQARRALAIDAARIARSRGTKAGLQLALEHALPDLKPQVLDNGGATWGPRASPPVPSDPSSPAPGSSSQPPDASSPAPDATTPAPDATTPAPDATTPNAFEVLLEQEPTALQHAQLVRCIADHLPVGAQYRYRVAGG